MAHYVISTISLDHYGITILPCILYPSSLWPTALSLGPSCPLPRSRWHTVLYYYSILLPITILYSSSLWPTALSLGPPCLLPRSRTPFVPNGAGTLCTPTALYDPRVPDLVALLDPDSAFPAEAFAEDDVVLSM